MPGEIVCARDVVAIEHAAHLMTGDLHRDGFGDGAGILTASRSPRGDEPAAGRRGDRPFGSYLRRRNTNLSLSSSLGSDHSLTHTSVTVVIVAYSPPPRHAKQPGVNFDHDLIAHLQAVVLR